MGSHTFDRSKNRLPPLQDGTINMSEALRTFFQELRVQSGRPARHISIISDNAKRMQNPELTTRRRRAAPGRSVSTPLNHMSARWEAASSPDLNSKKGSPSILDRKSRWESGSSSKGPELAPKLTQRRSRVSSTTEEANGLSPCHDIGKLRQRSPGGKALKKDLSTTSLPKSLRSLPY